MMKLNETNYYLWKTRMEDYLYCNDLYQPLLGDNGKPFDMTDEKWSNMHKDTVDNIRKWIGKSMLQHFVNDTKADVLWKKIENIYERKIGISKYTCLKKIRRLRYKDGTNMIEYLATFQGLINEASTLKLNLEDEMQALLLLNSLPDSWKTMVDSVCYSISDGVLTMAMAKDAIMNEDFRRKERRMLNESQTLLTRRREDRGRSQSREFYNRYDGSNDRFKSQMSGKCYHCKKKGHYMKECIILKKELTDRKCKSKIK